MKLKIAVILLLIASMACGGCSTGKTEAEVYKPQIKIGFSLADMSRDGNQVFRQTIESRRNKDNVSTVWMDARNDPEQQKVDIQRLIRQRVQVAVLQTVDPKTGPQMARQLTENNIKVLALENLPENMPVDGYITSDYSSAGKLEARYVAEKLLGAGQGGKFNLLVLQSDAGDQAGKAILGAVKESLQDYPGLSIVEVKDHPRSDPKLAMATVQQTLANHHIDAVLADDGRLAEAAVQVLKDQNLADKILTVGIGADKQAFGNLAAGTQNAEVDNIPEMLARYTYNAALSLAQNQYWDYDTRIDNGIYDTPSKITPVRLIDKENIYLVKQRWNTLERADKQQEQAKHPEVGKSADSKPKTSGGDQESSKPAQGQSDPAANSQTVGKRVLRITTQNGRTVEVPIDGTVRSIETVDGAGKAAAAGSGSSGKKAGQDQSQSDSKDSTD